jgi:hypothetical protein
VIPLKFSRQLVHHHYILTKERNKHYLNKLRQKRRNQIRANNKIFTEKILSFKTLCYLQEDFSFIIIPEIRETSQKIERAVLLNSQKALKRVIATSLAS